MKREWKWTEHRRKAAEMLASGNFTQEEIARACGVSDRTIRKWKQVPEFDERVREFEEEIKTEAKRYLGRRALWAARRLVEIAGNGTHRDGIKLRAAIEVLDRAGVIGTKGLDVTSSGEPLHVVLKWDDADTNSNSA